MIQEFIWNLYALIIWTDQPLQMPFWNLQQCNCNTNCSSRRSSCKREDLVCTDACGCDQTLCENKEIYTNYSDSEND